MSIEIDILAKDSHTTRASEGEIVTIPAGAITLVIRGLTGGVVRLDGRLRPVSSVGGGHVLPIDMGRSTGFHHISVPPGHDFWFATEDAKLRLDGIKEMLRYLRTEGLAWSGQLLFSDGSYMRDARVIYGWLDERADRLLDAAERIAEYPRRVSTTDRRVTERGGRRPDIRATIALLRRQGRQLLEPDLSGPVRVSGDRYTPRRVVSRARTTTLDTTANRRVMWLVARMAGLVDEIMPEMEDEERARGSDWTTRANGILYLSPLAHLLHHATAVPPPPARTLDETVDPLYAATFEGARALEDITGWSAQREQRPAYSYVRYADEIYQAFVAHTVAAALDLAPRQSAGVASGAPAFSGKEWDMYVNVIPPPDVIQSWRRRTDTPDRFRPDIVLRSRLDGAVVIGDAKYRNSGARASESSREEVMAYMAAFDTASILIFYPPDPTSKLDVHRVAPGSGERAIIEVTVSPVPDLGPFLVERLGPVLAAARALPTWLLPFDPKGVA